MLNRPSKAAVAPVALIIGVLLAALLLVLFAENQVAAQALEPGTISYAENGMEPVRVFTSTDPEGAGIDWDVTGTDADDFEIVRDSLGNGVLSFRKSPNYEKPTDRVVPDGNDVDDDADDAAENNMYRITVRATEMRATGVTRRALSTESDITVMVTNVNEPGTVDLKWLQPEVGTTITVTLRDDDENIANHAWTWTVSTVTNPQADNNDHWRPAGGTVSSTLGGTADGAYVPEVDDVGAVLRAVVAYSDGHSAGDATDDKMARGVSAYPVQAEVSDADNGSPGFSPSGDYARSVPENTDVGTDLGSPVVAIDPDGDTLTYELDNDDDPTNALERTGDLGFFRINKASGQITVARGLDFDENPNGANPDGMYAFVVRATDPSGEFDDQDVTVTATNENDAPKIAGLSELRVNEEDSTGMPDMAVREASSADIRANTYTAADQDDPDQVTWVALEGEDAALFELITDNISGANEPRDLKFKALPDFEMPMDANGDNVYKVILVAKDDGGPGTSSDILENRRSVTVFVDNVQEAGRVALSDAQPVTGTEMSATLIDPDNPDGDFASVTWQWFASPTGDADTFTAIQGATTNTYTPMEGDENLFLRVEATYTDALSDEDDPDTPQLDERVQKLDNTDVVVAKDPAGDAEPDFNSVYKVWATSDYAVKGPEGDGSGNGDGLPAAPSFEATAFERYVAENARVGDRVGDPVVAMGATGYTLTSGNDQDHEPFDIDEHGQITVKTAGANIRPDLNYEEDFTYVVEVTASGTGGEMVATVTISLIDLNESPYLTEDSREKAAVSVNENLTGAVANYQAEDPDDLDIHWEVTGPDAGDFTITGGALKFRTPPDFEKPTDRRLNLDPSDELTDVQITPEEGEFEGADNMYQVTVRATEMSAVGGGPLKSAELAVTVTVAPIDEEGEAVLNWLQPEVSTPIMVTVTDPDGTVDSETRRWYRSKVDPPDRDPDLGTSEEAGTAFLNTWELITGANGASYTPSAPDVGKYLLVRVDYEHGGADRSVLAISANTVRADVIPDDNNSPDFTEATTTRTVPENTAVGEPVGDRVVVEVNEDGDILTYEIVTETGPDGNAAVVEDDLPFFSIDKESGQLRVKQALNHEAGDGQYTIVVRATDPSNEEGEDSDDITVTITASNVNEAPRIVSGMAEISIRELKTDGSFIGLPRSVPPVPPATEPGVDMDYPVSPIAVAYAGDPGMNLYQWEDQDSNESPTWSVAGDDSALFRLATPHDGIGRRLYFRDAPDFEDPQDADRDNVYEVTVVVCDKSNLCGMKSVRLEVENVNEDGTLTHAPMQPIVGDEITPALDDADGIMTDSDGMETITSWQWYWTTSDVTIEFEEGVITSPTGQDVAGILTGETGSTYMATEDDVGRFLHARVTYRDGHNIEDDPVTPIITEDERDDEAAEQDRVVIMATENAVLLEAPRGPEAPRVDGPPAFSEDAFVFEIPENTPSTAYVGSPVVAMDMEDDAATPPTALTYDIGGPNANRFALAPAYSIDDTPDTDAAYYANSVMRNTGPGQIAVRPVTELDYESKKTYMVELGATDSEGQRTTTMVTIMVTDVNEAPSEPKPAIGGLPITGLTRISYVETDENAVETYRVVGAQLRELTWEALEGPDKDELTLARLGANEGMLTFNSPPDFEMPTDEGEDNSYRVTIRARVTTDRVIEDLVRLSVTITVTNVNEEGGVTLSAPNNAGTSVDLAVLDIDGMEIMAGVAPVAGRMITADLMDYDEVTDGTTTWVWAITDSLDIRWTDIQGENTNEYTPASSDAGKYLRVVAQYTDGHGPGKVESAITMPVAQITDPAFDSMMMMREVAENTAAGENVGAPVMAMDADGDTLMYSLSGTDMASFDIDSATGQLMTKAALNFEAKSTYTVMVGVKDNRDADGSEDMAETADNYTTVTINVMDVDEAGVTFDLAQPVVGVAVMAEVMDPDGVLNELWQWASSSTGADGTWDDILDAQQDSYAPVEADGDMYLRALVNYEDRHGTPKIESAVSGQVISVGSPAFADDAVAALEVAENTAAGVDIGDAFTATDADGDTPVYALTGTDAAAFAFDTATGQLMTSADLDYEMQDTYTVIVEVRDNEDAVGEADATEAADDTVMVTITVGNADEPGTVTLMPISPVVGGMVTAELSDEDGEVSNVGWQWARQTDTGYEDISEATSVSYTATGDDLDGELMATATYDDPQGMGKTAAGVSDAVRSHNTAPEFPAETDERSVAENTASGENIGAPVVATDDDADDTLTYTLGGTDMASFTIDGATGQLMTSTALDFETQASYEVVVTATDTAGITDDVTVTISVTNEDEDGTVTLLSAAPRVGTELTASVDDPDGGVTGETWQWASADTADGAYTDIPVATSGSYEPVEGDSGKFLRATASYTDAQGPRKTAQVVSDNAVVAEGAAGLPGDTNRDGMIDKREVIEAYRAYVADPSDKREIIEIYRQYVQDSASS